MYSQRKTIRYRHDIPPTYTTFAGDIGRPECARSPSFPPDHVRNHLRRRHGGGFFDVRHLCRHVCDHRFRHSLLRFHFILRCPLASKEIFEVGYRAVGASSSIHSTIFHRLLLRHYLASRSRYHRLSRKAASVTLGCISYTKRSTVLTHSRTHVLSRLQTARSVRVNQLRNVARPMTNREAAVWK